MTQGEDEKPQGYYPPSAPPQEYAQYPPQQYPPQAYPPQQYPPPQGYAPEYPPQYPPPGYPPQQYAPQPYPPAQYAPQPVPAQQFVPVVPAPTPTTDPDRFPEKPKYRDLLFAVLFFIQLGGVVVVTVFSKIRADNNNNDSSSSSSSSAADFVPHNKLGRVYVCCICGAAAAFLFSVIWLGIMKKFARQLIYFTLFASIVWCVVLAIVAFMLGSVAAGIVFVLLALLSALCYYFWRSRIPFATAVLQTVATVLQTYPAPTYYAYTSLIVQAVWIAIWILAFTWVQTYDSAPAAGLMIFLIFSFYWTSQVIKNVVHVTASGLYATWYFLSGVGMPGNPTHKAFKRAVTTSFGSICLGSLLVAILKTLRQLVDGARRNNNNIFFCLLSCILNILDNLLQYFNMYAFAQVAIYGKKYCDAAKDTWELIKDRGFAAIINDNLISGVLTMGAILGGASAAFVGALVAAALLDDYWVGIAFICFLLGIALVMVTMEVVESGVCTIFVCFAMDPHALQRNDPELYNKFVTTYHGIKV